MQIFKQPRNTYFIEMNKKFIKEQEGKGLSHAKTWNFKKFFRT